MSDDKSLNWERPLEFLCEKGQGEDLKTLLFLTLRKRTNGTILFDNIIFVSMNGIAGFFAAR